MVWRSGGLVALFDKLALKDGAGHVSVFYDLGIVGPPYSKIKKQAEIDPSNTISSSPSLPCCSRRS